MSRYFRHKNFVKSYSVIDFLNKRTCSPGLDKVIVLVLEKKKHSLEECIQIQTIYVLNSKELNDLIDSFATKSHEDIIDVRNLQHFLCMKRMAGVNHCCGQRPKLSQAKLSR